MRLISGEHFPSKEDLAEEDFVIEMMESLRLLRDICCEWLIF